MLPIPPHADVAFRLAANAAAAEYAKKPPYLIYRTAATVDIPSLDKHVVIRREVETRTADDKAILQDLPRGQRQIAHSFPIIPTFDALSYFMVRFNGKQRDALSWIEQVQPITFTDPNVHADVVVTTLRYYAASYAPDSSSTVEHIVMNPLPSLTTNNTSAFYLHDVYVDAATDLPTRVVYAGRDADLTCDYTTVDGHWLVGHVWYRQSLHGPLRIGSVTFTADAIFTDFAFPATAPDPALAGPPPPAK